MGRSATLAISAAISAAILAAAPAAAGDLVFAARDATPFSARAIGQPYWMLQARCAGLYGAQANLHTARGLDQAADSDLKLGLSFMDDAIDRLRRDRSLDFQAALALAGTQADQGRARSRLLRRAGVRLRRDDAHGFCLDVYDAYHHHRR